jgi:transposase InsO family protein
MISAPDRQHAVSLIDTARAQGARLAPACQTLSLTRRTYHRWRRADASVIADRRPDAVRPTPANKLSPAERQAVLDATHRSDFASAPPGQIVPALADSEGRYLASESTFYRVLYEAKEQHARGRAHVPMRHPRPTTYTATGPNQVWVWDISWLPTQVRGLYFYLYLVLDLYSRKVVAAEVYAAENGVNARALIQRAVLAEGCINAPPVLHADNGGPMKGQTLHCTLEWLGIERSFSRPRVSNDNAFAEAMFRTVKYRPDYPYRGFTSLEAAQQWVAEFVDWYNQAHRHSALKYVTPVQRHRGEDHAILAARDQIYRAARQARPERWPGATRDWSPVGAVTLNPAKVQPDMLPEKLLESA